MSSNPEIPRDVVHRLSEACAEQGASFQPIAKRLLENQPALMRFFKNNMSAMDYNTGEVSLYLLSVVLRIFDRCGGRLRKVSAEELDAVTRRIQPIAVGLLPADDDFPERLRGVASRAQPHILDEALFALFERSERKANEVDLNRSQAIRVFLMLWAATEALDANWRGPDHIDPALADR